MENDNENDFYEDVLPSFEMHNFMFNRSIYDTEDIRQSSLPQYDELRSCPNAQAAATTEEQFSPLERPELLVLNNLESLQTISLPLKVSITMTKKFPVFGQPYEEESPLRCFQPGEMVMGWVSVENTSQEPIPFEMFLVSLEGNITVPISGDRTSAKLHQRTFLRTYDISACYHHGSINPTPFVISRCMMVDPFDHANFGFPPDQMLLPGVTHKKFFAFRLPNHVLDTACDHELVEHLYCPPTYGVDPVAHGGKALELRVNEALGYGRLDAKGSPIVTNDSNDRGQSVSYSINLRILGRPLDSYKKFYKQDTTHDYKFIVLKDMSHQFRFTNREIPEVYDISSLQSQVEKVESEINDLMAKLEERGRLIEIGVTDPKELDRIIADKYDAKKTIEPAINQPLPPPSAAHKVKLGKRFLKSDADFEVLIGSDPTTTVSSFGPEPLERIALLHSKSSTSSKASVSSRQVSRNSSLFDATSDPTLPTEVDSELHNLSISLRTSEGYLPHNVSVKLTLKVINIHSSYAIPLVFNQNVPGDFYSPQAFLKMNRKFEHYLQQLRDLASKTDQRVPKRLYENLLCLNGLRYREKNYEFFEKQQIQLEWNKTDSGHEAIAQIPVLFSKDKVRTYNLLPSFQNCYLVRQYMIGVKIGNNETINVPIRVT